MISAWFYNFDPESIGRVCHGFRLARQRHSCVFPYENPGELNNAIISYDNKQEGRHIKAFNLKPSEEDGDIRAREDVNTPPSSSRSVRILEGATGNSLRIVKDKSGSGSCEDETTRSRPQRRGGRGEERGRSQSPSTSPQTRQEKSRRSGEEKKNTRYVLHSSAHDHTYTRLDGSPPFNSSATSGRTQDHQVWKSPRPPQCS